MTTPHESALLAAAEAMRDAEIGYSINLTRLVDGISEHTATLPDGSTHVFPTSAAASEFVERERNLAKAKAAVEAYLGGMDGDKKLTAWCQPDYDGKIHPRKFMVVYEDSEMGNAVFDDEAEAREHFEKASIGWNCYLFGLLPRQFLPIQRGGIEPNWWEEWVKTTRAYNKLAKAAQAVIDETHTIHDNEPFPTKYRAPYGSITKLHEVLASSDRSSLVCPPSIPSDEGSEKP